MNLKSSISKFLGLAKPVAPSPVVESGRLPEEFSTPDVVPYYASDLPQARYEGSYSYWGEESLLPATLQDSVYDATPGARMEMARKARYFARNDGLVKRLSALFEQYVAGATGFKMIPHAVGKSTDAQPDEQAAAWTQNAKAVWKAFCEQPEIDSKRCFGETQVLLARTWFIDGEVFILKTHDDKGRPKLQLIEAHRVATPSAYNPNQQNKIIDGVEVDAQRVPVAYWVRRKDVSSLIQLGMTMYPFIGPEPEIYDRIDAADMVHLFKADRVGLTRGITFLHAVIKDIHCLSDLEVMERKASRIATEIAKVWHTKTGEVPKTTPLRRVNQTILTQDNQGNAVAKDAPRYFNVNQGGNDQYLQVGEDVKCFVNERPTVAQQQYWDYLEFKLCAGAGPSRLLAAPYAPIQGTLVRSDLDTNNRFFLEHFYILARTCVEIYDWVMGWNVQWDRQLRGAPADWDRVVVRPPRSVSVDIGKQSDATINEVNAALRSRTDVCAEMGEDYEEVIDKLIDERAMLERKCKAKGVDPDKIVIPIKAPSTSPTLAPSQTPEKGTPAPSQPPQHNGNGHVPVNRLALYETETSQG